LSKRLVTALKRVEFRSGMGVEENSGGEVKAEKQE
jgi:hypothetical protein